MITQTGGASGGSIMSPYEYAVAGGFTGTEDEFKTALGEGPWLSTAQHEYVPYAYGYPNSNLVACVSPTWISCYGESSYFQGCLLFGSGSLNAGDYATSTAGSCKNSILGGDLTITGTVNTSICVGNGSIYSPNTATILHVGRSCHVAASQHYLLCVGYGNSMFANIHNTTAQSSYSGVDGVILGQYNIVGVTDAGCSNLTASDCFIIGTQNHVIGKDWIHTTNTFLVGNDNTTNGNTYDIILLGNHLSAVSAMSQDTSVIVGRYNTTTNSGSLVVGAGNYSTRKNGLRVDSTNVYGLTYKSSGADYAEMFQWQDDNLNNEDRAGHFVTLDGEYIKLAGPEDKFVLGVISGNPSIVGDVHDDQWHGIDARDIFGRPIYEDVYVPEEMEEIPDPQNPDQTITRVKVPAHTEHRVKTNPDYNPDEKYIPRSQRPEWATVGMMGKLVAVDDGTCQINGYAKVGVGGVATHSDENTRYRVMARLDDTHIRVLIL